MGSETKVVPTTSNTQQTVEIPQYLKDAGMAATSKAQDYASTPYTPFTGEQVAPLTGNQTGAIGMAAAGAGAGQTDMSKARAYLTGAGQDLTPGQAGLGAATQVAGNSIGAGQGNLTAANDSGNLADTLSRLGITAGRPAINQGTSAATRLIGTAEGTANAGMDYANYGASLAQLAGINAATQKDGTGAGAQDLVDARGYNAKSASPVSGTDIQGYFNPFVQMALDPVLANITRSSQQTDAGIRAKAAMSDAFGGGRSALRQSQNSADLLRQIGTTAGAGYSDAYDKALSAVQADRGRQGTAAGTSVSIAGQANTGANSALQRLIDSSAANLNAGTTTSNLVTSGQNRILDASKVAMAGGQAQSGQATDAQNRVLAASKNQQDLARTASGLSTDDVNRLISLVQPSVSLSGAGADLAKTSSGLAASDSQLTTDAINRLLTTGGVQQTQQQNIDNTAYQQYQNQQDYALKQLNALIAAAGGVPYGTSTDSKTQGTQVVQGPSTFGQVLGAASSLGGAAILASNRDWKEDFETVDDEDILAKFKNLTVESYSYKPEVAGQIKNGAGRKIGPMSGDWGREFHGDPDAKIIAMPEMLGALTSAVRALERRTAKAA